MISSAPSSMTSVLTLRAQKGERDREHAESERLHREADEANGEALKVAERVRDRLAHHRRIETDYRERLLNRVGDEA